MVSRFASLLALAGAVTAPGPVAAQVTAVAGMPLWRAAAGSTELLLVDRARPSQVVRASGAAAIGALTCAAPTDACARLLAALAEGWSTPTDMGLNGQPVIVRSGLLSPRDAQALKPPILRHPAYPGAQWLVTFRVPKKPVPAPQGLTLTAGGLNGHLLGQGARFGECNALASEARNDPPRYLPGMSLPAPATANASIVIDYDGAAFISICELL